MKIRLRASASAVLTAGLLTAGLVGIAGPAHAYTAVTLPDGAAADVLVDDAHQRVYISVKSKDMVLVRNLDGAAVATVTGVPRPGEMALSPDGSSVYVVQAGQASLGRINTTTYGLSQVDLPDNDCPTSVTVTGGKLWYAFRHCPNEVYYNGGIASVDPAAGHAPGGRMVLISDPELVRALPQRTDRLVAVTYGRPQTFDVTSGTPVLVATAATDGQGDCADAALLAGGDKLYLPCQLRIFNTADLSSVPGPAADDTPGPAAGNAVAASPDGRRLAMGLAQVSMGPDVHVFDTQTSPAVLTRTWPHPAGDETFTGALAWGANDRLYTVVGYYLDHMRLVVLPNASQRQPKIKLGTITATLVQSSPLTPARLIVRGAITCDAPTTVSISAGISQELPNRVSQTFHATFACAAGQQFWTAEVARNNTPWFQSGPARLELSATPQDPAFGALPSKVDTTVNITLRRSLLGR